MNQITQAPQKPGNNIMHSRLCLIFKVGLVFVSLSFRSQGYELDSLRDRDGSVSVRSLQGKI